MNRPKTLTRAFERYSKLKSKRTDRGANILHADRMDGGTMTASKIKAEDFIVTTPEEIEVLSALIEDKEQPEIRAKKEDRQHKSFFWIFVVFIVSVLVGYMKW